MLLFDIVPTRNIINSVAMIGWRCQNAVVIKFNLLTYHHA